MDAVFEYDDFTQADCDELDIGRAVDRLMPGDDHRQDQLSGFSARELGAFGENLAGYYLEERGYDILEKNYRCPEGEADLIAFDPDEEKIVLVEVKTRRVTSYDDAYPEEAVDERKRARYRRIASCYLMDRFPLFSLRFDVVAIQVANGSEARVTHHYDIFKWEASQ